MHFGSLKQSLSTPRVVQATEQLPVMDFWQSGRVSQLLTYWHWVSQRSRVSLNWQSEDCSQSALSPTLLQLVRHWPEMTSHLHAPVPSLLSQVKESLYLSWQVGLQVAPSDLQSELFPHWVVVSEVQPVWQTERPVFQVQPMMEAAAAQEVESVKPSQRRVQALLMKTQWLVDIHVALSSEMSAHDSAQEEPV
jgi:hypothetical protein